MIRLQPRRLKAMKLLSNIKLRFLNTNRKRPFNNNVSFPIDLNYNPTYKKFSPQEFLAYGIFSRALQLLTNDIAKVSFLHYKDSKIINSNLSYLLNTQPAPGLTSFEFKKLITWNLLLYGSSPILKVYNDQKQLISLLPIYPGFITKKYENNSLVYEFKNNQTTCTYNQEQIIWVDYEFISGFENASILSIFSSSINKIQEHEKTLLNAIKNDLSYSFFIKIPTITSEQQQQLAANALLEMIQRQRQQGLSAIVIDEKWDFGQPQQQAASRLDFSTRNNLSKEFASVLGIPPAKLGIEDSNKYNSSSELQRAYIDQALVPILINICQKLSQDLCKNHQEKIDFKVFDLLSLDIKAIQELAASGINNGFLSPNEIRVLIGLDPKPEGNDLLINQTLTPLKNINQNPKSQPPPSPKQQIS